MKSCVQEYKDIERQIQNLKALAGRVDDAELRKEIDTLIMKQIDIIKRA